jgi:hypothetical protein
MALQSLNASWMGFSLRCKFRRPQAGNKVRARLPYSAGARAGDSDCKPGIQPTVAPCRFGVGTVRASHEYALARPRRWPVAASHAAHSRVWQNQLYRRGASAWASLACAPAAGLPVDMGMLPSVLLLGHIGVAGLSGVMAGELYRKPAQHWVPRLRFRRCGTSPRRSRPLRSWSRK